MRIVFDTNVYISAFIVPGGKSDLAFRLAKRGAFELAVSPEILEETANKLTSKFGCSTEEAHDSERTIRDAATVVEPSMQLSVLEDEPDNRILECARKLEHQPSSRATKICSR